MTSTTLDHIYSHAIDKFCITGILTNDIADHLPIFCIIKNKTYRNIGNKFIQDMKHFDAEEFCVDFNSRLGELKAVNNPDWLMDQLIQTLTDVTNKHAPLRKMLRRETKISSKPRLTKNLPKMISVKNKLYINNVVNRKKIIYFLNIKYI